jgi:hypothetical protein
MPGRSHLHYAPQIRRRLQMLNQTNSVVQTAIVSEFVG